MKRKTSRSGQAMIEFMLGLLAIMLLVLAIDLIANIVYFDFTTIYSAREEVADNLMAFSAGTSGGSSSYDFETIEELFKESMNPNGDLKNQLEAYPGDRVNQFDFLWEGNNPLQDMVGAEKGSTTPITSPLIQKVLGRSSVSINNAIYMPPWNDLMQ